MCVPEKVCVQKEACDTADKGDKCDTGDKGDSADKMSVPNKVRDTADKGDTAGKVDTADKTDTADKACVPEKVCVQKEECDTADKGDKCDTDDKGDTADKMSVPNKVRDTADKGVTEEVCVQKEACDKGDTVNKTCVQKEACDTANKGDIDSVPDEEFSEASDQSEYMCSDDNSDNSDIIVHTDDEDTIHDDELGEALTALNLLLFEVKLDPLSFEDFKHEKKIKRNSKENCRNREAMGITEVSDHASIIGCKKLEPDSWMTAKLFSDILFSRASHLGVKMEKVGCIELIKPHNCNTTYLIQAVGERKNRPPQSNDLKIEYFCCKKKELDPKFDPSYRITLVLTLAELTDQSPHFFTNNLRDHKGYLRATPVEWSSD
eukprot:scaffold84355_cov86-Attheya_sp.AAC.2